MTEKKKPVRGRPMQPGFDPRRCAGGRPKTIEGDRVGGRVAALRLLDNVLMENPVREALAEAFRKEAIENPIRFFNQTIRPLMPSISATLSQRTANGLEKYTVQQLAEIAGIDMTRHESPAIEVEAEEIKGNDDADTRS